MPNLFLKPITTTPNAVLDLPGSKSIANRVLLLAAIALGTSIIHNVPDVSEDVQLMFEALKELGVQIEKLSSVNGSSSYKIFGCNGQFPNLNATLFCGNSGTTIRFLAASLVLMKGNYTLTGIERMYERPIYDLIDALRQLGGQINYLKDDGFPPLEILPFKDNKAEIIKISGQVSSQYLTGMLMALHLLKRDVIIQIYDELISKPYVEITLSLLKKFGCSVETLGNNSYKIAKMSSLTGIEYTVEPDASSASYFLAMGAIAGQMKVNNLSLQSLQGDRDFAKALEQMGAMVEYAPDYISVRYNKLTSININMEAMPDVAMTLAVMALFADGTSIISGISSWKVKETDRLQAMYNELSKLGAIVKITNDSITITPPKEILANIAIDTYNDHRMAMCFSLLAVFGIPITINNYQCVGKTFSNYFDIFNQVCYR